jgi:8-oxo-dGTP pyrophosphatase MutT (NUDIX family)
MELMQQIQTALEKRPVRIIAPGTRPSAAVAIILTGTPAGPAVLFIERARNDRDLWSGQIGFPGGRAEQGDSGPRETAERETLEELGLDLAVARCLGRIHDLAPGGLQIVVSCFVYAVDGPLAMQPDPDEVAGFFWFPLRELGNPARRTSVELSIRGRVRRFPAVQTGEVPGRPLWGITCRLLRNLGKAVGGWPADDAGDGMRDSPV